MGVVVYFLGALTLFIAAFSVEAGDSISSSNNVDFTENKPKDSVITTVTSGGAGKFAIKNGTCTRPNDTACAAGTNVTAMFTLNKDTGVLKNTVVLDHEMYKKFVLTIRLYYSDAPDDDIDTQELTINIINEDEAPVINEDSLKASFTEKRLAGALLLTVSATDPEGDAITYKAGTPVNDKLTVGANGQVKVATNMTLEVPAAGKTMVYSMGVVAESGNPKLTSTATITITMNGPAPNGSAMMSISMLAFVVSLFVLFM